METRVLDRDDERRGGGVARASGEAGIVVSHNQADNQDRDDIELCRKNQISSLSRGVYAKLNQAWFGRGGGFLRQQSAKIPASLLEGYSSWGLQSLQQRDPPVQSLGINFVNLRLCVRVDSISIDANLPANENADETNTLHYK